MPRPAQFLPLILAALVTLLNAAKPVVVDDTAYLFFARHVAEHPLDPYGFELFWYAQPLPAMQVLLPPVLPYWLAAGIRLFGEQLFLLKLWLFPFTWVLTAAVHHLFRRFAPNAAAAGTTVVVLSPAVLPLFNFMLDVPALALGTAAVALFVKACDTKRIGLVIPAGILVGLAMQTKYSMLVTPAVLGWYTLTRPNRWPCVSNFILASTLAVGVFAGWEWWLHQRYGESHFLHHLRDQSGDKPLVARVEEKANLIKPLLSHFGLLAAGVSFWVSRAAGFGRGVQLTTLVFGVVGIGLLAGVPESQLGDALPELAFCVAGIAVLVTVSLAARRVGADLSPSERRDLAFLIGWVAVEAAACVALTPFAAARRVMGLTLATAVLGGAAVSRFGSPRWTAGAAVGLGLAVYALDLWDAYPERTLAEEAARVADPSAAGTVWYNGHWGFQYYCERLGMVAVEPGRSLLKAGDRLIVPLPPPGVPEDGFYRPHHGWAVVRIDPSRTERIGELVADDPIRLTTLPSLYGGGLPVRGRDHPRVRLGVYRVTADWVP